MKQELEKSKFSEIMPITKKDKKLWTYVSWTAGVTEEILYRGFLLYILGQLLPSSILWDKLLIAALLFGLAHTYQGYGNVIRTSIIGLFFSFLYIALDSIIPVILLHFLIDYVGKIGVDEEDGTESQLQDTIA